MSSVRTVTLTPPPIRPEKLTWFRFGLVGEKYVITSDTGEWHALEPEHFSSLIEGDLDEDGPHYADLVQKGFIRNGFDLEFHATQLRRTKQIFFSGATQHRIHLSSQSASLAMEQAKGIIDHVLAGQAESFTLALIQGPKPPDATIISFIQEFAEEKNKYEGRGLFYELHSNLADIDDAMIALLVDKRIQIRAAFDGDAAVHDAQRGWSGAPPHAEAVARIRALHAASKQAGLSRDEYSTFGEVKVGQAALGQVQPIVAGLTDAGIREFRVTPVMDGEGAISADQYADFVADLIRHLAAQEDGPGKLRESQTDALLTRVRSGDVAEGLLMSTAPSTGYNARSYSPDGQIFPSCSALKLFEDGDPIFLLGHVSTTSAEDISEHPTIRSLMVASLTDCLPGYQHLWSAPYIGVDPVAAYQASGDLFPKMPTSASHRFTQAMVEAVFAYVIDAVNTE